MLDTHYNRHCRHGRPRAPIPVHPPFPSFAWVITAQANPPTHAYAHGYVQNAHTHTHSLTQRQTRLPAPYTVHHGPYQSNPRTSKTLLPPPSPAPALPEVTPIATHEMFMQTVDYRYDDPPTRPFVPWRASLPSYEMQLLRSSISVPVAYPSRAKRRRLDSLLRALRRACGLSKDTTRPYHAA
ncbi:hypothetical protein EI94DRAFT_1812610 [Lactarius quietus]|nr:hypothetical protein EI94DRAFT_1812610 [Lactarius quietus]